MPVNHKYKLIFLHIPKSAGSSVANFISSATGEKWDLWGKYRDEEQYSELYPGRSSISRLDPSRKDPRQKNNAYHHLILSDIKCAMGDDIFSTYSKFCVIRNPWDRLVSMYEYGLARGGLMGTAGYTFEEWFYSRPVTPVLLPWIEINGCIPTDLTFINFDSFNNEVTKYLANLGIDCNTLQMVHLKKSIRDDYKKYYNQDMLEKLSMECSADIEYFKFKY